eukprot:403342203
MSKAFRFSLCMYLSSCQTCFEGRIYPVILGTIMGESVVTVLDFSTNGDLAIGGQTKNSDFLATLASFKPYIAAIDNTHTFKFAKILNPSSNKVFTAVKYSYNQKLIIGQLDVETQYTLVFLNSTDGSLVKVLRSSDSFSPISIETDLITDSLGNLWYGFTNNGNIPHIFGLNYVNLTAPTMPHFMQSKWNDGTANMLQLGHLDSQLIFFTFYQPLATPTKGGWVAIDQLSGVKIFGKWVNDVSYTYDIDSYFDVGTSLYYVFTCNSHDGPIRFTRHTIKMGGTDSVDYFTSGNAGSHFQCSGLKAFNDTYIVGFYTVQIAMNYINSFTARYLSNGTVFDYYEISLPEMRSATQINSFYATYILDQFNSYYVGGTQKIQNTLGDYTFKQGFVMSNIQQNTCWANVISNLQVVFTNVGIAFSPVTSSQLTSRDHTMSVDTMLPLVSANLTTNINKYCTQSGLAFNTISVIPRSYTIGNPALYFTVPAFQLSSFLCTDGTYQDQAYLSSIKGSVQIPPVPLPSFITYNSNLKQFTIQSFDFQDYKDYQPSEILIVAFIKEQPSISGQLKISLSLLQDCSGILNLSFDTLSKQEKVTYFTQSGVQEYKFSNFTYNIQTCEIVRNVLNQNMTPISQPGISYNYLINKTTIFIDTDQYVQDTEVVIKLQIQYIAQPTHDYLDLTIHLAVKPNEKFQSLLNQGAPTFQTQIQDIKIIAEKEFTYLFPIITDPDKDNYSMKIDCGGAVIFTEISTQSLNFKPKEKNIGKYYCKVTLTDDNFYQKSSTTIINIVVSSDIEELIKDEIEHYIFRNNNSNLLKAKIKKITKYGEVFLKFNREIKIPPSCLTLDQSSLLLIIQPSETSDLKMLDFSWKITDCTNKQLVIQLSFENPLYVSIQERDQLDIIFMRNGLFKDASTLQPIKLQYTCSESIPNQLDKNSNIFVSQYFLLQVFYIKTKA